MPSTYRPCPPEFRAEAVRLARGSDKSIPALASDLGILSQALRHWLRQADAEAGRGQPGDLTSEEREELRRLRREVKVLQQAREMLRNGPEPRHTLPYEDGALYWRRRSGCEAVAFRCR